MLKLTGYQILLLLCFSLQGCIGTDIVEDRVDEKVVIETRVSEIKVGENYQFEASYYNNIGLPESAPISWSSSDDSVISIVETGLAMAKESGEVIIMAFFNEITDTLRVVAGSETVVPETERNAKLITVSSYPLSGTAILKEENGKLTLDLLDDFSTTSQLPGLYVYLTNNVSNINGALEIAKVTDFSGAQKYEIPGNPGLFEYSHVLFYCKPFLIPVGNGKFK